MHLLQDALSLVAHCDCLLSHSALTGIVGVRACQVCTRQLCRAASQPSSAGAFIVLLLTWTMLALILADFFSYMIGVQHTHA